jgi:predicted transcriptional regulator
MAIQPPFAQAILSGSKTIEFRKRALAPDIATVLIYETAPTQLIVGEFELAEHVVATPAKLWKKFATVGGIDADRFDAYFAGHERAVGLRVSSSMAYARGVALTELTPTPAVPQSFSYVDADMLATVRAIAACSVELV